MAPRKKKASVKLSTKVVADVVDRFGLWEALETRVKTSDIQDPELRMMWSKVRAMVAEIEDFLEEEQ